MKCSDLKYNLSLYADGLLDESEATRVSQHLEVCPLCRQSNDEIRAVRDGLRRLGRSEMPAVFSDSIKSALRTELSSGRRSWLPASPDIREWLTLSVLPYGVGVCASVTIGLTLLTMMYSGMFKPAIPPIAGGISPTMLAQTKYPLSGDTTTDISPADFAQTRLNFASESPSVNPRGALIALTKSFIRGGMKNDEVVVVADVFGDGLAQIAEVIEPSRDRHAVRDLEKALDSDPAYAPFVPANMENRPSTMRVVLKFQSVNVDTRSPAAKRKR